MGVEEGGGLPISNNTAARVTVGGYGHHNLFFVDHSGQLLVTSLCRLFSFISEYLFIPKRGWAAYNISDFPFFLFLFLV